MEKITTRGVDGWRCICGNVPESTGFYPCDETGKQIEPVAPYWGSLYVCDRCGRIIDADTLQVKGRRPQENWKYITYNSYAWFVGEKYSMTQSFYVTVDVNADIKAQLLADMKWQERHATSLKSRMIAGHTLTGGPPWYLDDAGKVVEIQV